MDEQKLLELVTNDPALAEIRNDPQMISRLNLAFHHLISTTPYIHVLPEDVFESILKRALLVWQRCILGIPKVDTITNTVGYTLREGFVAVIDEWELDIKAHAPDKLELAVAHLDMESRCDSFLVMLQFIKLYGTI